MSETKVSEPKEDAFKQRFRKVTRDRKKYGEIRYYKAAKVAVYWTDRRQDQYHRHIGGWMFEEDTISAVKNYGVTHVGVHVEDGTVLLTPISTFSKAGIEKGAVRERSNTYVDQWGRRGAICWHIPDALWARREPPEEIKLAYLREQMHVKRTRVRKSALTIKT